jgi:hypothetical protein
MILYNYEKKVETVMVDNSTNNYKTNNINVIKFVSDLRQVCGFLQPPRYNWNIVESDIKHHNPL